MSDYRNYISWNFLRTALLALVLIGLVLPFSLFQPRSAVAFSPLAQTVTVTCTVKAKNLNLRAGPGTTYRVLRKLSTGTRVTATGVLDDLTWITVVAPGNNNQNGWVSTDANLITCAQPLRNLPRVANPFAASYIPHPKPDGNVDEDKFDGRLLIPSDVEIVDRGDDQLPLVIFHGRMVFQLEVSADGRSNGRGVRGVDIQISDDNTGDTVYSRTENDAPYCAFGNSGATCDNVWVFAEWGNRWPRRDFQRPSNFTLDPDTIYTAQMVATLNNDDQDTAVWLFDFMLAPE